VTKSIFQEKNLVKPEELFNILGEREFPGEWSNLPLQVLDARKNIFKISQDEYRRNKYMADHVFKKLNKFLKDPSVTIYAPKKSWDEQDDCADIVEWKYPYFRISKENFLLIEQFIEDGYGGVDESRRFFWVEMPKEQNPLSFKKSGKKPKHDKEYIRSILPEAAKSTTEKITFDSLAKDLKPLCEKDGKPSPSGSWLCDNLNVEVKKIQEGQEF
jgi:hypothetical protein